jgi:hypothetical protein
VKTEEEEEEEEIWGDSEVIRKRKGFVLVSLKM